MMGDEKGFWEGLFEGGGLHICGYVYDVVENR